MEHPNTDDTFCPRSFVRAEEALPQHGLPDFSLQEFGLRVTAAGLDFGFGNVGYGAENIFEPSSLGASFLQLRASGSLLLCEADILQSIHEAHVEVGQ